MDEFMSILTASDEMNNQDIKLHLKEAMPQDVYDKWIAHFVVEYFDDEQITIGYYGTASLKKFERKYKRMVWLEICSYIGCVKKLNIYKRKGQAPVDFVEEAVSQISVEQAVLQNTAEETISQNAVEKVSQKLVDPKKEKSKDTVLKKTLKLIRLFIVIGIVAGLVSIATLFGCNHISNKTFSETFYNVGNIKANEKIRIIQITDLHNSTYGKENAQLIERVKKLNPDVIIYTGDCIEPNEESVESTIKLCSALSDVAPSYYVYGNNEVELVYGYALTQSALDEKLGFNDDKREPSKLLELKDSFEEKLEKTGVKVLKNETDSVLVGSTMIDIYGSLTSNPSSFWSYGGESFSDFIYTKKSHLKVFAIHEPFVFEKYDEDFWGDVMISGHTHGGIVRVPILGPLYTHEGGLFPERKDCYVSGRYSFSEGTLIVSPGLDNGNLFRINNKPELSIIDINRF